MTSNMIYVVAFGGGFKCLRKIHLNTQCSGGGGGCIFDFKNLKTNASATMTTEQTTQIRRGCF